MARKRAAAKSAQSALTSVPPPEAPDLRAWPVASTVNLENVIVEEFHAKRTPEGYTSDDDMAINLDAGTLGIGRDPTQNKLFIKLPLIVRAAKKSMPVNSEPSVRIECHFVLVYSVRSFEGLTDDQIGAFAQTSGIFNVWPFWRQAVHTASLHLGLPAIVLPTHRMGEHGTSQTDPPEAPR